MNSIDQRVEKVFREVFENDTMRIDDALSPKTLPQWDSLYQLNLIMGLEEEFGIKFTTEEVIGLNSVSELKRVVASRLNS